MPNAGMLDHDALQKSHPLAPPAWMPSWPTRGFGYRMQSARPRRHTVQTPSGFGQSGFSRHLTGSNKQQQQQQNSEQQQQASTSGADAADVSGTMDEVTTPRRRPFSAPAELQAAGGDSPSVLPITPFTTRLLTISDNDEQKSDMSSALWTSACGQRRLKGPNDVKAPFHTMQKVTCGNYFSRSTDHRMVKFGIQPVNTPRWRSEGKRRA
ncbi:uncharacterized protein LOC135818181 [Sycon ciliatum]|uniref:uncharacterized protein LOC135818181 n=1 Tax=Sycon ciliatum TaxID=27933 RepID=UPI0020A9F709|eukprot:scpid82928/ scgid20411/ 